MNAPQNWTDRAKSLEAAMIEACSVVPVSAGPGALAKALAKRLPDLNFRRTLTRGGWYRLGGVVKADGTRVSDDLEGWLEAGLAGCGDDLDALRELRAGEDLVATRLLGRTHYYVAQTGDGPGDFLQLEIEDLQEALSHALFDPARSASSIEELADPALAQRINRPLGLPCYAFRRLTPVGELLARIRAQQPEPQPVHRFFADWGGSSAGAHSALCNHWVLAVGEHLDRFRNPVIRAQPVPAIDGEPPVFQGREGMRELALHDALVRFDRQAGYSFAWFFHLLTTKAVPHWVARIVVEDSLAGFAYLPRRDEDVVRHWLHAPYAL